MQRFKRLGVFLHNSPADDAALEYAGAFATLAHSESLLCVHVRESTADEQSDPTPQAFEAAVKRRLPDPIARITKVEIREGTGVSEILRSARELNLDLIVVGRRLPSDQMGIGADFSRLARKAPCTVLVLPEHSRPHIGRALVAVDFSEHSKMALEQAVAIVKACGESNPQIIVHSNSCISYGYSKLGLDFEEAIAERTASVGERLTEFVADIDRSGVSVEVLCTTADETATAINEVAVARKMDMIVVGSRGRNPIFLLGSTAEKILHTAALPVLIVKQKGETIPVLDALFGAG